MGMQVNEAGGDEFPNRVDFLAAPTGNLPDCGNDPVIDRDVGNARRSAGSIDHLAMPDDQTVHCLFPLVACSA